MKGLEIIIPVIVAIVSSVATFFVAKGNNKVSDRKLLSEDEKAFREELRQTILDYKQEVEDTRQELKESREEIRDLRDEIAQLHKLNLDLTLENQKLVNKIESLSILVGKLKNKDEDEEIEVEEELTSND